MENAANGRDSRQDMSGAAPNDAGLTPASLFALDYLPVPGDLSDYVTTFYHFRCDEPVIRDIQPAAVGHLTLFPCGRGAMEFTDGRRDLSHEVNLLTPFSQAAPFAMTGPFHAIGAVLTPLGWTALTGLAADEHANRLYPACDWLGGECEELGAILCQEYRDGAKSGTQCATELGAFIADNLRDVSDSHADLIALTNRWLGGALDPNVEDLFAAAPYSRR
ncbi:MAG: hypothetical protein WA908_00080, partial [Pontixanthobacter sp.]